MEKRLLGATAALSMALLSSACGESQPSANQVEVISAGDLPPALPTAVAKVVGSVISSEFQYSQAPPKYHDGSVSFSPISITLASGVRIRPDTYLSAGHYIRTTTNKPKPGMTGNCPSVDILAPSKTNSNEVTISGVAQHLSGTALAIQKMTGSYIAGDVGTTPDIALISAIDTGHSIPKQTVAPIATNPSKVGDAVYFVNYQPTPAGLYRTPSQEITQQQNAELKGVNTKSPALTQPAIFGGLVIGRQANGDLIVADGLKSYDSFGDNRLMGGGSGGALFNNRGQLLGISVEATPEPVAASDLSTVIRHKVENDSFISLYESVIQPVTNSLITTLENQTNQLQVNCGLKGSGEYK